MVKKQIPLTEEYIPEEPAEPLSDPELYIKYVPASDMSLLSP